MILDVRCKGTRHPPTRLINLYNQVELGDEHGYTTLHLGTLTVITGDWNIHHNNWDSLIERETTPTRTQEVVDWLEGQGFSLCSKRDVHTRGGSSSQQDTVIDLTFANEMAIG